MDLIYLFFIIHNYTKKCQIFFLHFYKLLKIKIPFIVWFFFNYENNNNNNNLEV